LDQAEYSIFRIRGIALNIEPFPLHHTQFTNKLYHYSHSYVAKNYLAKQAKQ